MFPSETGQGSPSESSPGTARPGAAEGESEDDSSAWAASETDEKAAEAREALAQAEAALDRVPGLIARLQDSSAAFEHVVAAASPSIRFAHWLREGADAAADSLPQLSEQARRAVADAEASGPEPMGQTATEISPDDVTFESAPQAGLATGGAGSSPGTDSNGEARLESQGLDAGPGALSNADGENLAGSHDGSGAVAPEPEADGDGLAALADEESPIALWANAHQAQQAYEDMQRSSALRDLGATVAEAAVSRKEHELLAFAEAGNDIAFEIEMALADARKAYRAAQDAADAVPDDIEGAAALKAEVAQRVADIDRRRAEYQTQVAAWYELAENAVGAQGALSFGAGVDFGLAEDEFTAKWGRAIDSFFAGYGAPLAGYGEAMARSAYKWRIDPRLCAAVSITESSGGRYCIRPHNAWGWGAADSDPYGLAWQWGSWEEAIEAWHRGVATNTNGLATARTLTAFGEIYASSPHWATSTAASMRLIVPA